MTESDEMFMFENGQEKANVLWILKRFSLLQIISEKKEVEHCVINHFIYIPTNLHTCIVLESERILHRTVYLHHSEGITF